jgi:hypothetical protein
MELKIKLISPRKPLEKCFMGLCPKANDLCYFINDVKLLNHFELYENKN